MVLGANTVKIDGKIYELAGLSRPSETATTQFPGKVTFGDYSLDSNDLLSAWVTGDLTGGHGVIDLKEGVTDNRYSIGTIYTRHPNKWSKPFRITRSKLAVAGNVTPLGDMYHTGAWHLFFDIGGTLWQDASSIGSISFQPTNRAVVFQGTAATPYLFIPQGSNGYSTYEPAGNTRTTNADDYVAFLKWNQLLIAIDDDGQLFYTVQAAATPAWTSYGTGGKLDPDYRPKNLLGYWNRAGERAIFVVTDNGLWAFDPATPQLYEIPEITGVHPWFGEASCLWNNNLYIAAGLDIIEFNGSVGRNIGLSRDDGLPDLGTKPYVVDLVGAQNSLYAMMISEVNGGNYITSIHEWSGFGWCMIESRELDNRGIGICMSRASSLYRLIWGGGDGHFSAQSLPFDYTNPTVVPTTSFGYAAGTGVSAFSSTYTLTTGYFDANMPAYLKIANSVTFDWTRDADATLTVEYRADAETSWTTAFTTTTTGTVVSKFGTVDAQGVYPGKSFYKIQFKVTITEGSNNPTTSPILRSMVLSFLKVLNPSWSWTMQLHMENPTNERSPDNAFDELVALKDSGRFYGFELYDGTVFTARIASISSNPEVGVDHRRTCQLSIIEIREDLGVPV